MVTIWQDSTDARLVLSPDHGCARRRPGELRIAGTDGA
jgi:hypothetical protein